MNKLIFRWGLGAFLALFSVSGLALAAPQTAVKPKGTITQTLNETFNESLPPPVYVAVTNRKFTASVTAGLGAVDSTSFNGETGVGLKLGGYLFAAKLKDDPNYAAGASKKAVFALTELDRGDPNNVKTINVGSITFAWSAKTYSVAFTLTSLKPNAVLDDSSYTISGYGVEKFDDTTDVTIHLGAGSFSRTLYFVGRSAARQEHAGLPGSPTLRKTSLVGAFDFKAPVLKRQFLFNNLVPKDLELDYYDGNLDYLADFQLSVNGRTGLSAADSVEILPDDGISPGQTMARTYVFITGLALDLGKNVLIFTATDESGNISTVKKIIIHRGAPAQSQVSEVEPTMRTTKY
ncbi:MAG: hypothetical protein JWL59_3437 [Chthoniobacteraceae bacterium]|nr:hypothetical protein [Chthoniobacteraceae bacterium]